ncbi:hypothetical protein [Nostoc sp.]|uniref:hypothetical protein n=1 Tax=Nostoc sp. TaxID=1180 RepID=UPI002FF4DAA9
MLKSIVDKPLLPLRGSKLHVSVSVRAVSPIGEGEEKALRYAIANHKSKSDEIILQ